MPELYQITAIAKLTLLEALRSRVYWLLLLCLVAVFGFVQAITDVAITESVHTRTAILALVFRLAAVIVVTLFTVASVTREHQDHSATQMLSTAMPRAAYLLGKYTGVAVLAVIAGLLFSLPLLAGNTALAVGWWGSSLIGELLIVAAFALLCAMTFNQVTLAVFAVAGFYTLARSIEALQLMLSAPLFDVNDTANRFIAFFLDALALLLPSLNRFADSAWLLYPPADMLAVASTWLQTLVFAALLLAVGLFDVYRREY